MTTWLTTKEAAKYLGTTPKSLYDKIRSGQIPYFRFGKCLRFRAEDLDQLMVPQIILVDLEEEISLPRLTSTPAPTRQVLTEPTPLLQTLMPEPTSLPTSTLPKKRRGRPPKEMMVEISLQEKRRRRSPKNKPTTVESGDPADAPSIPPAPIVAVDEGAGASEQGFLLCAENIDQHIEEVDTGSIFDADDLQTECELPFGDDVSVLSQ